MLSEVRCCRRLKSDAVGGPMLSEVEVRCCRRLKSDAVGGPMLSEVEVRRCWRPKKVHLSASIRNCLNWRTPTVFFQNAVL